METWRAIAYPCMFVFTAVALVCDLRTRKLPNVLTVPAFGLGLLFHAVCGFGGWGLPDAGSGLLGARADLGFALGGFGVGFGLMLVLWLIGGSGGGDVKFMGALGAWLGAWITFQVLCVSALFAAAITIVISASGVFQLKRSSAAKPNGRLQRAGRRKAGWGWEVPFGVPAALGTWCVLAVEWAGYGLPWPPVH
jgi:prepilin peptidase CpaA